MILLVSFFLLCCARTIDTDFLNTKKKQVSFQLSSLITPPVSTVRFCDLNFGRLQPSDEELGPHKRFEFGNFVAREALLEEEYWVSFLSFLPSFNYVYKYTLWYFPAISTFTHLFLLILCSLQRA